MAVLEEKSSKRRIRPYKLSLKEKELIANKINFFRVMPKQVLTTAGNLEHGVRSFGRDLVTHDTKSVLVGGRIMLLNCKDYIPKAA
jgi:hypothetical protein